MERGSSGCDRMIREQTTGMLTVRFTAGGRIFYLLETAQTSCGVHSSSYYSRRSEVAGC